MWRFVILNRMAFGQDLKELRNQAIHTNLYLEKKPISMVTAECKGPTGRSVPGISREEQAGLVSGAE